MDSNSLYHSQLRSGDYHPKVNYYYFKQWDDFRMPFHEHNSVEIMYVITGQCQVDVIEDTFTLKKGDFILIDANVSHRLMVENNNPCRMLNIEFVFEQKMSSLPSMKQLVEGSQNLSVWLSKHTPYVVLKDPDEIYHTLKSLVIQLDDVGSDKEMMIQLLLAQVLIRIATLAIEAKDHEHQPSDEYVKNAITYIQHHYDCDIQVKDIAASVNVHPGYLHRIFKASMDCTVMEYLVTIRMEKAKMLLAHTDIPIADIASYVGINSREYFSSLFRKHTDSTPLRYRRSLYIQVKSE
ncbi:MAG: AraC family transcriptional regulator [Paenibacillaceae bacterium]